MTVRELIVALLDEPMDAEVETSGKSVTGVSSERPGGSPHGLAYVYLNT